MTPMNSNFHDANYTELNNGIKKDKIKQKIKHILKSQLYGVLATSYKNQPYTSLLAFVASEDITSIYVATGKSTHKYKNVNENEKVAFFIDTRANNNFDVNTAYTLTVFAKAKERNRNEIPHIKKLYLSKHPHLNSFIHSKNVEFVQFKVSKFSFVERFQNVYLLEMDNDDNNSIR
jgi:nitroimidazol reductase NimA-like FMN-containing flavoprotein (pyridoxamine 5'-phosphate oxidase superfamily)